MRDAKVFTKSLWTRIPIYSCIRIPRRTLIAEIPSQCFSPRQHRHTHHTHHTHTHTTHNMDDRGVSSLPPPSLPPRNPRRVSGHYSVSGKNLGFDLRFRLLIVFSCCRNHRRRSGMASSNTTVRRRPPTVTRNTTTNGHFGRTSCLSAARIKMPTLRGA